MSRKSSHARGVGLGHLHVGGLESHMQHSHSHRSLMQKELVEPSPHHQHECEFEFDEELINPDEFEEIAEIYDSIRLLH